jgi:Xaa-Pro aminopeptidase
MRHHPIPPRLFTENRRRLTALLQPKALAIVNNNDVLPTNADGALTLQPNTDLFYLTGIEQEESVLVLFPDALEPRHREVLFLREPNALMETWEGRKLTKEEARKISGIERIVWLSEFPSALHLHMCEAERVYLNANEHSRASILVETRESRFVRETVGRYPLHEYHRLAPLLHRLRAVKSAREVKLLRRACDITREGFERAARFVRPGVSETDVEAEFAHEFIRRGGGFAYTPIIAGGVNACVLHYIQNDGPCRDGELLLLDVASRYANYNADLTRTIPVNGRFTRRQRRVYNAVLRVFRQCAAMLKPGLLPADWRKAAEEFTEKELVDLKLLRMSEVKKQGPEKAALKRYFMHGLGHPLGLDVHDVAPSTGPIQAGWVMTCEPGIYIREEKMGVRIENDLLATENGSEDLMAGIPIEADEIEALMAQPKRVPRAVRRR